MNLREGGRKMSKKSYFMDHMQDGDYNESSDIDIMILTDLTDDEMYGYFVKVSDMAYDIEEENNFDIEFSPLIKNIDKFNYWLEALPFYMNVQKEGVVLSEC